MSGPLYVGIDPGLNGAIASYLPEHEWTGIVDMPTLAVQRNDKARRQLDHHSLAETMRGLVAWNGSGPVRVIIEQVAATPGDGAASMFQFGAGYGAVIQAVVSAGLAYQTVPPGVWKRHMGLVNGGKDASRLKASQLFPGYAHLWSRVKDDGRAEALLLARYAHQFKVFGP